MSSSKHTCHLDIQSFLVTDQVNKKYLRIECCPTDDMIADFFMKPLQGTKFRQHRDFIMRCHFQVVTDNTEPVVQVSIPGNTV
jgi:hypothetical protein